MNDKEVIIKLAQYKLNHSPHTRKQYKKYIGESYSVNSDTEKIYDFALNNLPSIPNDSDEIIKREDWNIPEHFGEIENSLMSPQKWTFFDYIYTNPRQKNKILVVLECSNSKPYCQDTSKQWFFKRFRSWCDFACGAYGIVPEEYSMLYPVREDEWSHSKESESVAFQYSLVSCNRGYQYIKEMGYEHVIVLFQSPGPEEFMRWMENIPDRGFQIHFVLDETFRRNTYKKYPQFGNYGMFLTRLMQLMDLKLRFVDTLKKCLSGDELTRLEGLEGMIRNNDKKGVNKWIRKTNKLYNIKPYNPTVPSFPTQINIPTHTTTSDLDESMITVYMDWIRGWVKKDENKLRVAFSPLNLLTDLYNLSPTNPVISNIDKSYWNMVEAMKRIQNEVGIEIIHKDKYNRHDYLWTFSSIFNHISRDKLMRRCDVKGLSQFFKNISRLS